MVKKFNLIISYLLFILLIVALGIISYLLTVIDEKNILINKYTVQDKTLLSMMIENENGNYEESESNEWPGNDYILNKDRSGCENGGILEYKDNNVYVKAASSDRCYVYFAKNTQENRCALKYEDSLVCDLIESKDNSLIYHDGKCDYEGEENCTLEAGDLSYRFVGANPNNYVCFGTACSNEGENPNYKNLYRIIGFFKNEDSGQYEMKIIKADAATKEDLGEGTSPDSAYYGNYNYGKTDYKGKLTTFASYYWNDTAGTSSSNNNVNMWAASNLNTKNLNGTYYDALDPTYQSMVVEHKWEVGGFSDSSYDAKGIYDQELGSDKLNSESNNCYTQGNMTARQCSEPNDLTYTDQVGLMYISDYMYGTLPEYWDTTAYNYQNAEVKNNDWLYLGLYEWTISRSSYIGNYARNVDSAGHAGGSYYVYNSYGVRPVLYLSSNVKITEGSGTDTSPYKISY